MDLSSYSGLQQESKGFLLSLALRKAKDAYSKMVGAHAPAFF